MSQSCAWTGSRLNSGGSVMTSDSSVHLKISAKTGDSELPIPGLSTCLNKFRLK